MFKNKFALITGAGGLLGVQHAGALAEIGFNIVLLDIKRKGKSKLGTVVSNLRKNYPNNRFLSYDCDISSEDQIKKVKLKLNKNKIHDDVLVNNADRNPKIDKKK